VVYQGKGAFGMSEDEPKPISTQDSQLSEATKDGRKSAMKKGAKKSVETMREPSENAKSRGVRTLPASTFQNALVLAGAFQRYAAGQTPVRGEGSTDCDEPQK
jgi:hypothetical protein